MHGDGHHSEPPVPDFGSGKRFLSPEMETLAGYLTGLVVARVRSEFDTFRDEISQEIENAVQRGVRPVMVSAEYLAHLYSISAKTVHRRCRERGIPKRDMHGHIKPEEDCSRSGGLTFYSLDEWEATEKLSTRSITNRLRKGDRRSR